MGLELIVVVATAAWCAVLLLVVSLCRAAKSSDDAAEAYLLEARAADQEAEIVPSPSVDSPLRTLDLDQAAAFLGVIPEMLLAWEARYGFPTSSPSERLYSRSEILALRDTLRRERSIAAAVARARERTRRRRTAARTRVGDHHDGGLAS
ncbi:MAG TPA: hypothetical protein VMB27_15855 [Solirubrobacteraceae bacterium]|nr:hypothetical protein [Solirubrobacteraceae bacterium]